MLPVLNHKSVFKKVMGMENSSDAEYFTERAMESRTAATSAEYPGAHHIHSTLANSYDGLASKAGRAQSPRDVPCKVTAMNGEVQVEGLEPAVVAFTPNAARLTSDSLLRGANEAEYQCVHTRSMDVQPQDGNVRDVAGESEIFATGGQVVQTPTKDTPYKVVLEHELGADTESPVSTMREGEALIKKLTPTLPERDTRWDRPAPALDE